MAQYITRSTSVMLRLVAQSCNSCRCRNRRLPLISRVYAVDVLSGSGGHPHAQALLWPAPCLRMQANG